MKKILLASMAALALVLSFSSCNEEINLSGEFSETAVIYGLLDKSDSVHMIKITRAFIGPGNSLEIAQNPDSSYFNSVNATITEMVNGNAMRTWTLIDTIVDNKDENGIFYAPEQKLYAFYTGALDNSDSPTGQPLRSDATYALFVDLNDGEFQVTGETEIVDGITTQASSTTYHFKFAQDLNDYKNTAMSVNPGNATVVNSTVEIGYYEFEGPLDSTLQVFDWNLGDQVIQDNGANLNFTTSGETFYSLIANNIENNLNPAVDKRNFSHLKVTIVAGAQDLYDYMTVNKPSSALAQNKPTYTNMEATNGHRVVGVFSSRFTLQFTQPFWEPLPTSQFVRCIDKNSTEELCMGQYTGPYLFCSQHSVDIALGYSWACP